MTDFARAARRRQLRGVFGIAAAVLVAGGATLFWSDLRGGDAARRRAAAQADGPRQCDVQLTKTAAPARVVLGQTVFITLTADARCADVIRPLHVAFVVDNSIAVGGPKLGAMRNGVNAFIDTLDFTTSRAGLVVYHSVVEILSELSADPVVIKDKTAEFFPRLGSNMRMGLMAGDLILQRGRGLAVRPDVSEVIVLLAGNVDEGDPAALLAEADRIKARGVTILCIGVGGMADFDVLGQIASGPNHVYTEADNALLADDMRTIAAGIGRVRLTGAFVTDTLPADMSFVWGSDDPPARPRGADLLWNFALWPSEGLTLTYEVEPKALGRHATNVGAEVELRFDQGPPKRYPFPVPEVEVVLPPTATSTSSPTPTASPPPTPTPVILPAYLPVALRRHCTPDLRGADFIIVIDTSLSMVERTAGEPKLAWATLAASAFMDELILPADRAGVVVFNNQARLLQSLSANLGALQYALLALFNQLATGTRLDLGLQLAADELAGVTPSGYPGPVPVRYLDPERDKVIVVLTDGQTDPERTAAVAARIRGQGVTIYTIGLGDQVDGRLLERIAGSPSRYFPTADGQALADIYRQIASYRGCP
ncbi:MAG: VWA domain-containing protein [Ardenticatenales bacterium]|nr:VWA domain-containing protein [Ardenticatenales bacterium]